MNYHNLLMTGCLLVVAFSLRAQQVAPAWTEVAPGVWKTEIGNAEDYDLFTAADITPNVEAIRKMEAVSFPFQEGEIAGLTAEGKTSLTFPLEKNEQIFGFGLNFKTIHQRGRILELHVDHYGGKDNGRTHAPVPFYVSDKGYGVRSL